MNAKLAKKLRKIVRNQVSLTKDTKVVEIPVKVSTKASKTKRNLSMKNTVTTHTTKLDPKCQRHQYQELKKSGAKVDVVSAD